MQQEPDIIGPFKDRVRRHVSDGLRQYRDELRAVSHEMAARGLVQQAGDGATQCAVVRFNAGVAQSALEDFVVALNNSATVPDQIKSAAMIEVETIRPQLKKAAPNVSIVREGLHSLRNILEGVVGGLLATKLAAVLAAVGIAIS